MSAIAPELLPPPVADQPIGDLPSMLTAEWVRDKFMTVASTSARSLQAAVGPSEIGQECQRRLAYRIAGTPVVNHADPTSSMIGTGFHVALAEGFARLDGGSNRYLIEHGVEYRGVTGHVDLHDRFRRTAFDWKTSSTRRITRYRTGGPPNNYVIQANIYAQGLIAAGESVDRIALVFVPRDGGLDDIWAWVRRPDQSVADKAIDRYETLRLAVRLSGPAAVPATPVMCAYCPNYREHASDLSVACPGKEETA